MNAQTADYQKNINPVIIPADTIDQLRLWFKLSDVYKTFIIDQVKNVFLLCRLQTDYRYCSTALNKQ